MINCTFGPQYQNLLTEKISITDFLERSKYLPVIDVRSPGEFQQGHIPGAINLPLFENEERSIVGTIFKNSGRDAAILKGLELAGPKLAGFVKKMHRIAPQGEIMIHCWRGGMRSDHMGWLFDQAGFKTAILTGGYKSYRKFVRESFSAPSGIVVLGGLTGSSKTDILHQLKIMGKQVLDLEMFACHKGSAFGALGQPSQRTNEQFENDIHSSWKDINFSQTLWIEDESRTIGNVYIPDPLFDLMGNSPMIKIEIDKAARIRRLVKEYSGFDPVLLKDSINKISEKLGGTRTKQAITAVDSNDFEAVAELVLTYYDKAYDHAVSRRMNQKITTIKLLTDDPLQNAKDILNCYKNHA